MSKDKDMLLFLRERAARDRVDEVGDQIMSALEKAAGEDWDGMDPPTLEILPGGINVVNGDDCSNFISLSEALDHLAKIAADA